LARGKSGPILEFVDQGTLGVILSAVVVAFVGAAVAMYHERPIVIFLTSAVGTAFWMLAWECTFGWRADPRYVVGGMVALSVISCYVQCRITGRADDNYGQDHATNEPLNGHARGGRGAAYVHPRDRPLLPTHIEISRYFKSDPFMPPPRTSQGIVGQQPQRRQSATGLEVPLMARPAIVDQGAYSPIMATVMVD